MATALRHLGGQFRGLRSSLGTTYRFRRELLGHLRSLLGALGCSIGYTAMRLAEPWPLKIIFDNVLGGIPLRTPVPTLNRVLGGDRTALLVVTTIAILVFALVRGVFYYYQNVLASRVGQQVVLDIRRRLFAHMQRLSLSFHAKSSTGDLLTRLTGDVNMLRELLVASLLSFISEVVVLVGFVSVMFWMEWRLALASVVVIPVVFTLVTVYSGRIRDATRKQRKREGELASRLHQALNGIHIVQLFAREDQEDERLRGLNKRSLRSGLKATRLEAQLNRAVELSLAGGTAVTLWLGALQVIAGRLTPGELIVFVSYMQSFYRPLRRISRVAERATKADSCVERITNVLDQASDVWDGWVVAPRSSGAFKGALRFRDMTFEYKPGRPVLREIDFAIAPGQTVALVGPTGAGKSTLLGLVPRLWDPSSGVVEVDGRDVRDYTLKSLRDQIAVVPQDGMLFSGTIRENILYGKPEATVVDLEAAARAARIHDHIVSLPEGYDTSVGERGVTLSGGQRQRLAIARALVKDAPIVLLDEPTTGLDAESESLVMEALDRLLEGRTALVIAHRLATVRRADLILVLDEGRVVESGTHEDLLASGGRYRALYDRQFDTRLVGRGDPAQAFV